MPLKRNPLFVIYLTMFIDLLGIGILVPVIPQLLGNPDSPQYLLPQGMSLEMGYIILGALVACYPIAQFFASPILGQLSDRYGRRPILMASVTGTAIGYVLFAIGVHTGNLPLLFFSRILDGITGGNLPVAQATIADVTTPENRARNFGRMGAIFGLGFIMGPYIGGQLADSSIVPWFDAATPFWFAAILSTFNAISISLLLQETHPQRSTAALQWGRSLKHIVRAFTMEKLRWFFLVEFLFHGGAGFMVTFFGVYLITRYGFDESGIGNLFAYIGIWIAFTQGVLTPLVHKKWKERSVLSVTFLGTAVTLLLFLLPGPWTVLLFVVPIFAMFNGLTQANVMAYLSRSVGPDVQGEILGINASVSALSQAIPPVLSGIIAAKTSPSMTIVVASVLMIIASLLFMRFVRFDPSHPVDAKAIAGH
jgi:DHA1 family tetracycline resistance protein-like MFS transporter